MITTRETSGGENNVRYFGFECLLVILVTPPNMAAAPITE